MHLAVESLLAPEYRADDGQPADNPFQTRNWEFLFLQTFPHYAVSHTIIRSLSCDI